MFLLALPAVPSDCNSLIQMLRRQYLAAAIAKSCTGQVTATDTADRQNRLDSGTYLAAKSRLEFPFTLQEGIPSSELVTSSLNLSRLSLIAPLSPVVIT